MPRLELTRTWIDRMIERLAPVHAQRRLRARAGLELLARHYEGASHSPRHQGWRAPGTSAAGAATGSLATLRNRSRDLIRNNGWATEAQRVSVGNVIGPGIAARFIGESKAAEAQAKLVRQAWKRWAIDEAECDGQRAQDFFGLQELVVDELFEAGEVLVRKRPRRTSDGLSVPLQLELLEVDHIDEARDLDRTPNGGRIVQGVQFDRIGLVEGYWLFRDHPGDPFGWRTSESYFVPASEILHVFLRRRAGQVRGVPWLAGAVVPLRDLDETEDAHLIREKIAACFVAFKHYTGDEPDDVDEPDDDVETLHPGMVARLKPGEEITFGNPPPAQGFDEYTATVLRKIAASAGLTYEELTGDYRRVNFSSGRMGWTKSSRWVRRVQRAIRCQFCAPVFRWWIEAAQVSGALGPGASRVQVSWDAPRREMLDPTKETAALRDQVRAGFVSLSGAIRERGLDPREVLAELAQDGALLAELGLKLDTDPMVARATASSPPDPPEDDDESEDEQEDGDGAEASNGRALEPALLSG